MTYEGTRAAISLVNEEAALCEAVRLAAKALPKDRSLAVKETKAYASLKEAQDTGYKLIADEVLPAILGGEWRQTKVPSWFYTAGFSHFVAPLFDHTKTYRLVGSKGPTTWKNAILVSEPYNALSREGDPAASAVSQAARLRKELIVATWVRKDLSIRYPGWTSLVLVGSLLDQASDHGGFTVLA